MGWNEPRIWKNLIIFIAIFFLLYTFAVLAHGFGAGPEPHAPSSQVTGISMDRSLREGSYEAYIADFGEIVRSGWQTEIRAVDFSKVNDMQVTIMEEVAGSTQPSLYTEEMGSVEWTVDVPQSGHYHLVLDYYPVEGKSSAIERELWIDGERPFLETANLIFPRVWANEGTGFRKDNRDHELRPRQIEAPRWQQAIVQDREGYYEEPYLFYLSEGTHVLELRSIREPMILRSIHIGYVDEPPTYAELAAAYEERQLEAVQDVFIKIQGEDAHYKSDPMLYPVQDRMSPATEPYDVSKIRMNMIGGFNWRIPGQWLEWEFEVPESGLYQIAIKSRQNVLRGLYSTRNLTVDGKIPFQEMKELRFLYDSAWKMVVLGDGKQPYLFHLTEGKHTIRMEVTLGSIAPLIRTIQDSVLELNDLYRQIIKITGTTPDPYRDYVLDEKIPQLEQRLLQQSEIISEVAKRLEETTGEKSDKVSMLYTASYQLNDLAERPETIQHRLKTYKDNVGALGAWILNVREQPLDIDYLIVSSPHAEMPRAEANWLAKVKHELLLFGHSFFEDYNSIGDVGQGEEAITVWIGTGRDQAQVLKAMIDDTFTPQTGIPVHLKLVDMAMLLPATLASQGPDVAMQIGIETPVNFAMRSAAQSLNHFPRFEEISKRFQPSALVPYQFENELYALPEQQVFSMLFYRKDILDSLNLEVPETWDDVYEMLPVLQKNHMQFELPLEQNFNRKATIEPNAVFAALLYQSDGAFYTDGGKRSALDSEVAMRAFRQWTEFYTSYKLPLTFDFPTRFRIGEMPIGIADYTMYNYLSVSAPEIRGLWEFAPIPGTLQEDGSIRRDQASNGTAIMMLSNSDKQNQAWEFMDWWTSKDVQVRFGREMEGLMGAAARYPTATIEALAELPWPAKDYQNLSEQWQWVHGIPEVPGGYFTGRHLDNAFRTIVNDSENVRETLYDFTQFINDEIVIKRREFGLDE